MNRKSKTRGTNLLNNLMNKPCAGIIINDFYQTFIPLFFKKSVKNEILR